MMDPDMKYAVWAALRQPASGWVASTVLSATEGRMMAVTQKTGQKMKPNGGRSASR